MNTHLGTRHQLIDALKLQMTEPSMLYAARLARVVPWSMNAEGEMHWGAFSGLVLGYSAQDLAAQKGLPFHLIPEEDSLSVQRARLSAEMGFPADFECRMLHKAGHAIWTRWFMVKEGREFHGAIQDISTQHAIQEKLILNQKKEVVEILASGLAHDLNNLLMTILGCCEILETEQAFSDLLERRLSFIKGEAVRGKELIHQLIRFVRRGDCLSALLDLNATLMEARDLLRQALHGKGELELDLAADLPRIYLDPSRIRQAVMNLVLNARDAIGEKGRVTLRTRVTGLDAEFTRPFSRPPGKYLALTVEDNGSGIPKEHLPRIFEAFYSTKGTGGSGLGLFTANQIVAEHGGFIECYSQPGVGTRLRIYLPVDKDGARPNASQGEVCAGHDSY